MTNLQKTGTLKVLTTEEMNEVTGGILAVAGFGLALAGAAFMRGRYLHSQNCPHM